MARRSSRNRRGGNGKPQVAPATNDRYEKYLPTWMRNGAPTPPRPPRPRRARQQRPAGGYTPGKFALDGRDAH